MFNCTWFYVFLREVNCLKMVTTWIHNHIFSTQNEYLKILINVITSIYKINRLKQFFSGKRGPISYHYVIWSKATIKFVHNHINANKTNIYFLSIVISFGTYNTLELKLKPISKYMYQWKNNKRRCGTTIFSSVDFNIFLFCNSIWTLTSIFWYCIQFFIYNINLNICNIIKISQKFGHRLHYVLFSYDFHH